MELNSRDKYLKENTESRISSEILTKKNRVEINKVYKINTRVCIIKN